MKLLYQFGVILAVTFVGELLYALLPLPIPASIYGLIVMLICLGTKVVKLSQVKIAADFLIDIMPPMFIPAAVGLIVVWGGSERDFDSGCRDHLPVDGDCDGMYRKGDTDIDSTKTKDRRNER